MHVWVCLCMCMLACMHECVCEGETERCLARKNKECQILEVRIGLEHSKQECGHGPRHRSQWCGFRSHMKFWGHSGHKHQKFTWMGSGAKTQRWSGVVGCWINGGDNGDSGNEHWGGVCCSPRAAGTGLHGLQAHRPAISNTQVTHTEHEQDSDC